MGPKRFGKGPFQPRGTIKPRLIAVMRGRSSAGRAAKGHATGRGRAGAPLVDEDRRSAPGTACGQFQSVRITRSYSGSARRRRSCEAVRRADHQVVILVRADRPTTGPGPIGSAQSAGGPSGRGDRACPTSRCSGRRGAVALALLARRTIPPRPMVQGKRRPMNHAPQRRDDQVAGSQQVTRLCRLGRKIGPFSRSGRHAAAPVR
jgi:hypothetical protein